MRSFASNNVSVLIYIQILVHIRIQITKQNGLTYKK